MHVYLIVKVQYKAHDTLGPDIRDVLQDIINVGYEFELEGDMGDIERITVLEGLNSDPTDR